MSAKSLNVRVRHQAGVAIIDLQGDINAKAEEALTTAYADVTATNPSAILLNLENVKYITSVGITLLVRLVAQAHEANRRLAACGLNNHYHEVFQITRLTDFIEIFPDEAGALSKL